VAVAESVQRSPSSRVVVIGAGPCGLACARELERLGHRNWTVLERNDWAGGLAASVVDPAGFTWDLGGHVVFSHFGEFDRMLVEVMGEEVLLHERSSFVRFRDRWVPYPFQNNLRHLPREVAFDCIAGLIEATGAPPDVDFATWISATFGPGITEAFMAPYNAKVWATPLERMSAAWLAERVAVPDRRRALRSLLFEEDDLAWGPNNRFAFPAVGGTGEIYRRLASSLGDRVRFGVGVAAVDPLARVVFSDVGERIAYDVLISTIPIDLLVAVTVGCPDVVRGAATELEHNDVYVVGVGVAAPLCDDRSWLYFPDPTVPFYRVTNFARYAPAHVPGGDVSRFSSLMAEVSHSRWHPVSADGLADDVESALRREALIPTGASAVSHHVINVERAYPVPTRSRDRALGLIQPWLESHGVLSRGRMGSWKYEIGNMDHAVKMGIDAARRVVTGAAEEVWS
jgi:UDP-galactopyranose mutase